MSAGGGRKGGRQYHKERMELGMRGREREKEIKIKNGRSWEECVGKKKGREREEDNKIKKGGSWGEGEKGRKTIRTERREMEGARKGRGQ